MTPENTRAAFATATTLAVSRVERDLGITRDGVLVNPHDSRLKPSFTHDEAARWLGAPGPAINSLSLEQLQHHEVG